MSKRPFPRASDDELNEEQRSPTQDPSFDPPARTRRTMPRRLSEEREDENAPAETPSRDRKPRSQPRREQKKFLNFTGPPLSPHARKRQIAGALLLLVAIFLALAILSYTSDDAERAEMPLGKLFALLSGGGDDYARALADTTHNWLGIAGAKLSNFVINDTIGYAAFIFPLLVLAWGSTMIASGDLRRMTLVTAFAVTLGIIFAGLIGTSQLISFLPHLEREWSGAIGQFVATVLARVAGTLGAGLILFTAFVITMVVGIDLDLHKTGIRLKLWYDTFIDYLARKREERQIKSEARKLEHAAKKIEQQEPEVAAQPIIITDDAEEPARMVERELRSRVKIFRPEDIPAEIVPREAPAIIPQPAEEIPAPSSEYSNEPEATSVIVEKNSEENIISEEPLSMEEDATETPIEEKSEEPQEEIEEELPLMLKTETDTERIVRIQAEVISEEISYALPTPELLDNVRPGEAASDEELEENGVKLVNALKSFRVEASLKQITPGPVVTLYELTPATGVKVAQIEALQDDIALALKARGIRIIAPMPGRGTVGVEIANHTPQMVSIRSVITSKKYFDSKAALPIALGKTVDGEVFVDDLAKLPHLLIAGATGSGKSVGINSIIASLLFKLHPSQVKFVIIDPKKVELSLYKQLSHHFLTGAQPLCDRGSFIVTSPDEAKITLKSVVWEMEERYDRLAHAGVRNISDYNDRIREGRIKQTGDIPVAPMPYIVVIIDELADLMITAARDVEEPIARIAQMARAVGIHLILATQRPSVDVITGVIKANFPARIAYQVASRVDSRTILDGPGADALLGNGDMLYQPPGSGKPIRIQNAYISTEEVEAVVTHIASQEKYSRMYPLIWRRENASAGGTDAADRDELFEDAARVVIRTQQGSASILQRKLKVGYSRASRLIDQLEEAGIVGAFDGSKPRAVMLKNEEDLDLM